MNILSASILPALLLAAGAAAAQTPPAAPTPVGSVPMGEERVAPPATLATPDRATAAIDHLCLRETGTLIRPRRAQASRERCPSHVYGRVWTQDDLRSTGQPDLARALRTLDPSIR